MRFLDRDSSLVVPAQLDALPGAVRRVGANLLPAAQLWHCEARCCSPGGELETGWAERREVCIVHSVKDYVCAACWIFLLRTALKK